MINLPPRLMLTTNGGLGPFVWIDHANIMRIKEQAPAHDGDGAQVSMAPDPDQELMELLSLIRSEIESVKIDTLKAKLADRDDELARLREDRSFPAMNEKLADYDAVGEASLTTADLTEDVIQKLTAAKRKKFTELLNVELAELQQERGGPREDLKREGVIEATLGLFSRVGEM